MVPLVTFTMSSNRNQMKEWKCTMLAVEEATDPTEVLAAKSKVVVFVI